MRPEAIRRIARLEVRARGVVEGVLAGLHKSPFKGQSVEFLQHRPYVRGDDLRRVDWKVWGRQDRLTVKEFEEETSLRLSLVVDGSGSMDYDPGRPSGRTTKYDHAATLAASLAWLALSHGDAAGCTLFDDRVRTAVPPRTLVLSDFLGDRAGLLRGLRLLRQRGHDLAVIHVLDDDELEFPFEGPTRFDGLELPASLACNPRALRAGYLEALEGFLAEVRRGAAGVEADYVLARTGEPAETTLVRFLTSRVRQAT
ncbi:MAG: DUF58 domain-containing protein [Planctomycetia bacterium]|nr:DUF58 domain-containing protein [Planctomycetia bacterium]